MVASSWSQWFETRSITSATCRGDVSVLQSLHVKRGTGSACQKVAFCPILIYQAAIVSAVSWRGCLAGTVLSLRSMAGCTGGRHHMLVTTFQARLPYSATYGAPSMSTLPLQHRSIGSTTIVPDMHIVGMWLMMSCEETRRWMMTPSDIVRNTSVVQ